MLHHFDDLVSSIEKECGRAQSKRNWQMDELRIFSNQTDLIQRLRQSPVLFAMGAATAITSEKVVCWFLSEFGCQSAKQKTEQLECRLHNLESQTVHLNNFETD